MTALDPRAASRPVDPQDWGPTVQGGKRRRGRRWLVLVLVVVLVAPALYGFALLTRMQAAMGDVEVSALSAHTSGPRNFLVIGSDSRADLSEEEKLELGTGDVDGERTDSIFVLSVSGSQAAILAFPRDLYIARCDGSTGRINAALGIGGPDCLVDTVEGFSGLPVHHLLKVSFGGFRDIVDAVGGVDVCVDKPMNDPFAGLDIPAGCQTLTGVQALGYVRSRKLDNDLERIRRQQTFLGALAKKLMVPATVVNPTRAFATSEAVGSALEADSGLGTFDLLRLANGARGLTGGNTIAATVPANGATIGGAAVLQPDEAAAAALFASFRDGSIFGEASGDVRPADVRVQVLNGAGISGLAAATRDALVERGYDVVGIGDTEATASTVVRYPAGQRAAAELLARDLPVAATLEEVADATVITLVLGQNAGGAG